MCQLCNDSLLAAANAASLLAKAAKDLYSINCTAQSNTLANAAAELFEVAKTGDVKPEMVRPAPGKGSPNESKEPGEAPQDKHPLDGVLKALLGDDAKTEVFRIEDGIAYVNGLAIGRVVVMGRPKPTSH